MILTVDMTGRDSYCIDGKIYPFFKETMLLYTDQVNGVLSKVRSLCEKKDITMIRGDVPQGYSAGSKIHNHQMLDGLQNLCKELNIEWKPCMIKDLKKYVSGFNNSSISQEFFYLKAKKTYPKANIQSYGDAKVLYMYKLAQDGP